MNKVLENRKLEKGGINTRAAVNDAEPSGTESGVSRKVLSEYFAYIREQDDNAHRARIEEVLERIPNMAELYEAESKINAKLLTMRPGPESLDARQRLRAERIGIEEKKKDLLAANGFPVDYLNRKYRCEKCKDTGSTDEGMVCSCCKQRALEAYEWHTNK